MSGKPSELFVFEHSEIAWVSHRDFGGENCLSRIVELFYPWHSDYISSDLFTCLDCGLVGHRSKNDLTEEEYQQKKKEAGLN